MRLRFWPNETVRVRVDFVDEHGAPMPATNVLIVARPPARGELITGSVIAVADEVGAFEADFDAATAGRWAVRATCTGPTPAAVEAEFHVTPSLVL